MAAERRTTNSKTVFVFIIASIVVLLGLAYLFKPPPRVRSHRGGNVAGSAN